MVAEGTPLLVYQQVGAGIGEVRGNRGTYRVAKGTTLVGCQLSRQGGRYEGPVAVQLEDIDVVCRTVCSAIADEVTLQQQQDIYVVPRPPQGEHYIVEICTKGSQGCSEASLSCL